MLHLLVSSTFSNVQNLQSCSSVRDTYVSTQCCNSPDKGLDDASVFPPWQTRRDSVTLQKSSAWNVETTDRTVTDVLMSTIAHRRATESEFIDLEGKSVSTKIQTIGYKHSTLALMDGVIMTPDNQKGVNKAIIVIGGGFAIEACNAFVRTGGHCYFGSRTAMKQEKIKQSIQSANEKTWSTAQTWTEVTNAEAQRIHMATVDIRNYTATVEWLRTTKSQALANSAVILGMFLASGSQRLAPMISKAGGSSVSDDKAGHPDYFTNDDHWRFPDQRVSHYYSNVNAVDAMDEVFAGQQSDMTLVLTGSHITLSDMAGANDIKRGYSPLSNPPFDAEYVQAKKLVQEVRKVGMNYGFKTDVIHPTGCYTDWYTHAHPSGTSFWGIMWGVSKASSQATDLFAGKLLSPNSVKDDETLVPITQTMSQTLIGNLGQFINTTTDGQFLMSEAAFNGSAMTAANALAYGFMPEVFINNNTQMKYYPRAARFKNGRYETNDYQRLTMVRFWRNIYPKSQTLIDYLDTDCTNQLKTETEPFCTFTGKSTILFSAIISTIEPRIAFLSAPFSVGMGAANALMRGTTNKDMYQYGILGDRMASLGMDSTYFGTNSTTQDEVLLHLMLDGSASTMQNRRFVAGTTTSTSLWI